MLVKYRGTNNKGVLERPGKKWKVLRAISSTVKCQFTGKCWKVDFPMPRKTKSAENLHVWPYARCGHPGNLQTSSISTWIVKKTVFGKKTSFPFFGPRGLVNGPRGLVNDMPYGLRWAKILRCKLMHTLVLIKSTIWRSDCQSQLLQRAIACHAY